MKATELRIGNLVYCGDKEIHKITYIQNDILEGVCVSKEGGHLVPNNYFAPIPLTEEWLLRFGFKKRDKSHYSLYYELRMEFNKGMSMKIFCLTQFWKDGSVCVLDPSNLNTIMNQTEIKYVHTLQNLYFALTGEELKIKE